MPPTEAPATPPRKKRARRKAEYLVQRLDTGDGEPIYVAATSQAFDDAAAAKKFVRESGEEGKYRVVRIVDEFTAKREVRTVTKLS